MADSATQRHFVILCVLTGWLALSASPVQSASTDEEPEPRDPRFAHFVDQRTVPQAAFEQTELLSHDLGRSFALLVGVDTYPGLAVEQRRLTAAARDLHDLTLYLRQLEFFDEIVFLQNEDVTEDNLNYFLQVYFPERLLQNPRSRFLFAYTGHGFRTRDRCYLLQTNAETPTDKAHAMSVEVLMARYREVIGPAFRSLALINGCHWESAPSPQAAQGAWRGQAPGHHVITVEGSMEKTWQVDHVGPGSRFNETLLDGLLGTENSPSITDTNGDGLVDMDELWTHLSQNVNFENRSEHNPRFTQLSSAGDPGGFFFFESGRQIEAGVVEEALRGRSLAKRFGRSLPAEMTPELETFHQAEIAEWKTGCRQGHAKACGKLGLHYQFGIGVDPDVERAAGLYRHACENGDAAACSYLGSLYYEGKGVQKDLAVEVEYSRLGCDGGNMRGCNNLAASHLIGAGIEKSLPKALQLLSKSCEAQNAWACFRLGMLYWHGQDVEPNFQKAAGHLRQSCDGGNVLGCRTLARMYLRGSDLTKDPEQAAGLFHAACRRDAESCTELGNLFWHGHGVGKDRDRAFALFVQACHDDDLTGCHNIGLAYENGDVAPKNLAKALQIFRTNCNEGFELSCTHFERLNGLTNSNDESQQSS